MNNAARIAIVSSLIFAVGLVLAFKSRQGEKDVQIAVTVAVESGNSTVIAEDSPATKGLPLLLDVGSSTCIPCKMMKPILDEMTREQSDHFRTVFIDIRENPEALDQYRIRIIPTQIFFDAAGNELMRHEGFIPKEDILNAWVSFGLVFDNETTPASAAPVKDSIGASSDDSTASTPVTTSGGAL